MHFMVALVIILASLVIGEIVSVKTKAFVPSVFVTAVIFLIGYWTVFPADIVDLSGFQPTIVNVCMYLLIVNMGTLLSYKELLRQWKVILICIGGIGGICLFCLTLGSMFFGRLEAIVATPPLAGGIVAAIVMSDAAKAAGFDRLSVLAIVMYVMQGFAGYPLTSWMLKKEGNRLLAITDWSKTSAAVSKTDNDSVGKTLLKGTPEKYDTNTIKLLKLAIVGLIAYGLNYALKMVHIEVHALVICLIFGVVAREIGFLQPDTLAKSGSFGITITALLAFIFGSLNRATPEMLASIAIPLVGIIALGVIGMAFTSLVLGKALKISFPMSFAASLTALYGFPANYIITNEVVASIAKNDAEKKYLLDNMLPKMLVGGFTTVTVVSVILAGMFAPMIR